MSLALNLGCGNDRRPGWVNVDLREDIADVVCDVRKLEMWGDGEVDEIQAFDLLEHFPASETAALLAEWARVLRPAGILTVKVPNIYQLARGIVAYTDTNHPEIVAALIRNVMGGHRWGPDGAWDTHHTNFTPALIQVALELAGFEVLANDGELNMTVVARKPL